MKKVRVKARAIPDSHEWGYSTNTNTEQVGMKVEILDGEFVGQFLTWYGYFTEKSEDRTLEQLEIAGWNKSSVIDLPGLGSTEFELILEEQEDQDEHGNPAGAYWRPTFINRIGVAMRNKMDEMQKRAFAARIGARVGAPVGGTRPGARPAQRPAARPAPSNGGTRLPAQYAEGMPFDEGEPMPNDDIGF